MSAPPPRDDRPLVRVDLDALRDNLQLFRERLPADTEIAALVKARGYGHGMLPVARRALAEGCRALIVAHAAEALALTRAIGPLREADGPFLLLVGTVPPEQIPPLAEAGVVFCLGHPELGNSLQRWAAETGHRPRAHLKIDTGMGRYGFLAEGEEFDGLLERLPRWDRIDIEGVMTHYSEADHPDSPFSMEQNSRFDTALGRLEAAGLRPRWVHIANSAGALNFPDRARGLARLGISMYGAWPDWPPSDPESAEALRPVMHWTAHLLSTRQVPAGTPISYGRSHVTTRPTRLGIVPVGYGHGYPRAASGRAEVGLRGRRVPVLGRVTMNFLVIDLTELPEARPGDEVLLFGESQGLRLRVEELARAAGTIAYEILCNVNHEDNRWTY